MASGRLGVAAPAANTFTTLYTAPADKVATVNIAVLNRGQAAARVIVAASLTDAPELAEYIEDCEVPGRGGVLERTAVVLGAGERVVVHAAAADCSVRIHGFEEDA